ncbi:MAG: hypothetical protein Q9213_005771 [Squamulea squamosa]
MLCDGPSACLTICHRIVELLRRSPIEPERVRSLRADDVYLYQSGMAAIYHVQHSLLSWRGTHSIVFGFTYELTPKILETFGPHLRFYGFGTDAELVDLENFLVRCREEGNMVQALWCECPSNPLLRTPNLKRLRALADEYHFPIVLDDTIGSFANIDVMNVADILVTSLTKTFSGFADVMGGSAVLNPSMQYYSRLKEIFHSRYRNDVYVGDAIQLERNSRSFLQRSAQVNSTTHLLVDYFWGLMSRSHSPISAVYYPNLCWSAPHYRAQMRRETAEFTPGYGGLFTIEFQDVLTASTFFNNAMVHKGPSLGANVTLLQPYVQTVFYQEKEWAADNGLKETIVRVSVGLEDPDELLKTFRKAMLKAYGVFQRSGELVNR